MFNRAIFMVIMSWPSAAYNGMLSCDPSKTGKTESILLYVNHFKYAANIFTGIDDKWKNHLNIYSKCHADEICD